MHSRHPLSLELREISAGKYSLVMKYEVEVEFESLAGHRSGLMTRTSVIFSTHDRLFAIRQAHLYAIAYKVPLTDRVSTKG